MDVWLELVPKEAIQVVSLVEVPEKELFDPRGLLDILTQAQADGSFPAARNRGLIRYIPKTASACSGEKLRPIAKQQLKKKWFMTILLIQVEDILRQITLPQQVGCIKHRQMAGHQGTA